jgi:signal transduction histidine kinase
MYEKELEQERLLVEKERHRLQEAQTQFIQNVSHELRTPLALVYGHAAVLNEEDGPLTEEQRNAVGVIVRRSEQLKRLVDDILIIMEIDQAKLNGDYSEINGVGPVDMRNIVSRVVDEFTVWTQRKAVKLQVDIEGNPCVLGSHSFAKSVVDNLVSNAVKFTETGGISVNLKETYDEVVLTVKDTGIGMSQENLNHIFDRFCQINGTAKRRYGGTGLGLAVVREVVLSMHGKIEVESVLGEGSTFRILLPKYEEKHEQ